jgi:glycosyltransferase involved in cell wall biosynthesis
MHMLYLVPEFPSQTHAFFWREILALRNLGVQVSIVSTRRPPANACRHAFAPVAAAETTYLFPSNGVVDLLAALRQPKKLSKAWSYIRKLDGGTLRERLVQVALLLPALRLRRLSERLNADHLHVHSFANAAHVAALSRILGGCAYSLTLHGDLSVYGKDHHSKVSHAAFVVSVTRPLQQQVLEETGLAPQKNHLLWMGVDTRRFLPLKTNTPDSGALRVLTVARLHPNKGHLFALQAIAGAREAGVQVKYVIVGEGPARSDIESGLRQLKLEDVVTLAGTRSEDEVLEMLQEADVLVLPSIGLGEAAPVAVMEAMACGLPVVCSIIGGTRDMVDEGVDGFLVEQQDVKGIQARLMQLAVNTDQRQRMGRAARARAEREFDCNVLAARLLQLVERHTVFDSPEQTRGDLSA